MINQTVQHVSFRIALKEILKLILVLAAFLDITWIKQNIARIVLFNIVLHALGM